jgi:putative transposase
MAYCILPYHIHLFLQLPEDIRNFSYQIREIKRLVTVDLKKQSGQRSLEVWQDRFWEHTIRDEKDLERHFDYIHYNPVKHGYVDDALAWEWSSYPDLVSNGYYQDDQLGLVSSDVVDNSLGE